MAKRKSKSKHANRQKKNDEPKKNHHEPKVKEQSMPEKKHEPKAPLLTQLKSRIASLLLIFASALAIVFIGAFFVKKIMEPIDVADLVPADETVMIGSIDGFKFFAKKDQADTLKEGVKLPMENLKNILEESLSANFTDDISPWLGYKHGYALLKVKGPDGAGKYEHVLFVQSVNRDATFKFLKGFQLESLKDGLIEEEYKGYSIYGFAVGQNVSFLPLDGYFVFGGSPEVLKKIVDVKIGNVAPLKSDVNFLTVRNNLKNDIGFVYYKPSELFDYYVREPTSGIALVQPVLSLFDGSGHSVILDDNSLVVQTYINFKTELGEAGLPKLSTHYRGELLDIMPQDFEYFWGSRDLSKVVTEFGAVLNQLHPSSFNIMEGVLNAKKEQYFGYEVDMRDEIYKVFENEFALGLYSRPDRVDYLFVAGDQDQDLIYKLQAYYMSVMQERGFKILAESEEVGEGGGKSDQISVFPFDGRTNMYTAMHENIFVMSTDRSLVEDTLTHIDENGGGAAELLTVNSYLKDFDEMNIASPAFMSELLPEQWGVYLANFSRIRAAKSIFPSGMALVHVFEF